MNARRPRPLGKGQSDKSVSVLVTVTLLAVIGLLGIYLGKRAAYSDMQADPQSVRRLQIELAETRDELAMARGELEVQRTRNEVDRQALEMVRREMASRKERSSDLEEDLRFYRSLMTPDDTGSGLSLRKPELVAINGANRIAYRIAIQQRSSKHQLVKGSLSVEVDGVSGGEELSFPLEELVQGTLEQPVVLQFRYFQVIEGELTLPQGFEPRGITVVANTSKPQKTEVREQFSWQLQERFSNVGN